MIVMRFGTWSHEARDFVKYDRIYIFGRWTPWCWLRWRDELRRRIFWNVVKDLVFEFYENWIMGTWLGRFRIARWGSNKLYFALFKGDDKNVVTD